EFATGLNSPFGLAFDAASDLYVSEEYGGDVRQFSPIGVNLGVFGSGLSAPAEMEFDSQGYLYVADSGAGNIHRYSPTGAYLGVWAANNFACSGLALNNQKSGPFLFVVNWITNTIEGYSATGADLGVFASIGLVQPVELALDHDGNIYASQGGDSTNLD